jgi:hypothetical protein
MLYWNEIVNDLAKILQNMKECLKKKIIFPPRYYANCVSTTLTVSILHNIESVYFVYSNPVFVCFVFIWEPSATCATYSINWLVFITEMKCLLRGTNWVFK